MRALRALLYLAVGLILGGGSVLAYAQARIPAGNPGPTINFNYPGGINSPRRSGGPIYGYPDAPNGWGKVQDINKLSIGGKTWDFTGTRNIAPRALAGAGIVLARAAGPLGIGMALAPLVWDAIREEWLIDGPLTPDDSHYWISLTGYGVCLTADERCIHDEAAQSACASAVAGSEYLGTYSESGAVHYVRCTTPPNTDATNYHSQPIYRTGVEQTNEPRPATDAEIEDAIYAELVARGMGSELARRLIEAGYMPPVDSVTADGPTSIPGETTTTTRQNGDGTTTTVNTTTNHNVTYNTNTTNNTTTVTITNNTTTTTTNSDGMTTTETKTETPAEGGQEEQPEQYTLTYSPSAMPDVPDFYEQKYPHGFSGAWDEFKGRVAASSLAGFINGIGSGLPGGGTCPSWSMSLNMGAMGNFGTFVLEPPCVIWPFIKAVMILSALFVARRLVVGG